MPQKIQRSELEALITEIRYTRLDGTTKTFAHVFIGEFSVTGESACLNPADFDKELGEKYAFENAFEKLWQLEGYHRAREAMDDAKGFSKMLEDVQ